MNGNDELLIGNIYRSSASDNNNNKELCDLLKSVVNKTKSHVLLMGDFNFKEINWSTNTTSGNETHPATLFRENTRDCFLSQHVTQPTRYRENDTPSLLDLILTNEENMVDNLGYMPGLGKSDHLILSFDFICYTELKKSKLKKIQLFQRKLRWNEGRFQKCKLGRQSDEYDFRCCLE